MSKLQYIALNILHSKYKIVFTALIYSILYLYFYGDKMLVYCMNENFIPEIAESKPTITNKTAIKTLIQREVECFCGFADIINEQKSLLKTQQLYIHELETDLKLSEEKNVHLKGDVHRITCEYLNQEYEIKRVKSYNQKLYSDNVDLRRHIVKLEEELKQLKSKFAV